jgi:hypothetical protein
MKSNLNNWSLSSQNEGNQMKAQDTKLKNLLKGMLFGSVVVAMLVLTVGCGDKKKSSNNNSGRRGWWGGSYNPNSPGFTPGYDSQMVTAGGSPNGEYMVILAISSDPNAGSFGSSEAWVEGELNVQAPIGCPMNMNIGLDPDVYELMPYQNRPAFMSAGMLSNVFLVARGRYSEALVSVPYATSLSSNVCGFRGMVGALTVHEIDGYQCGMNLQFTDRINPGICGY